MVRLVAKDGNRGQRYLTEKRRRNMKQAREGQEFLKELEEIRKRGK
jgi:hypothetical protein